MKHSKSLLLSATMILTLTACASGQQAQQHKDSELNAVLEQATHNAFTAGKKQESTELLAQLYKRNSDDPLIAIRYARALRESDELYRASLVLTPFIRDDAELDNDKVRAAILTEYASLQAAMGNYAVSEEHARRAILATPNNGKAYHVLGIALDTQGFHKQAEAAFRKAMDNWSGDPGPVMNNLGLNLAAQGFLDEAVETLRKAYAASPNRREIERNLRIVTALQNKPFDNIDLDLPPPPVPGVKPLRADQKAAMPAKKPAESKEAKADTPEALEAAGLNEEDTAEPITLTEKDVAEIAATPPRSASAKETADTEPAAGEESKPTAKEISDAIAANLND